MDDLNPLKALAASLLFIAASAAGARAQPTPVADRALMLVGTWRCSSYEGTSSLLTFVRNGDGSLIATNQLFSGSYPVVITGGNVQRTFAERYSFDPKRQLWTNTDTWNDPYFDFGFTATAPPWTGVRWQFAGRVRTGDYPGPGVPQTKTYTFTSADEFQRQIVGPNIFEGRTRQVTGTNRLKSRWHWSDSVCKRAIETPPPASPAP
jgi:hypothetical protein